jgi:hypothetical protein
LYRHATITIGVPTSKTIAGTCLTKNQKLMKSAGIQLCPDACCGNIQAAKMATRFPGSTRHCDAETQLHHQLLTDGTSQGMQTSVFQQLHQ